MEWTLRLPVAALLVVAGCASNTEPDDPAPTASSTGPPWFEETASASGIDFVHVSGQSGDVYLMPESIAGGVALFDMDGDGDLDAYLVQSGTLDGDPAHQPRNALYRNRGDGTFDDVSAGSGADDPSYGIGVTAGDYDNDGDVDLYVTNLGPNVLLQNDGDGRFTDVTTSSATGHAGWGTSATFFDYDLDGDLDLYACNYVNWSSDAEITCFNEMGTPDYCLPTNYNAHARDVLYRNEGDGTFTDVSAESGLGSYFGTGLGVASGDFNRDGYPDLFVANDGMRDQLWANQTNGTFSDIAVLLGCGLDETGKPKAGMGVTTQDVDDDGDLDVLVCNLGGESDSFYINEGRFFTDTTAGSGIGAATRPFTRFGLGLLDFDNDGTLDLYAANGRVMRRSYTYTEDPYAEPNVILKGIPRPGQAPAFEEILPHGGTSEEVYATSRGAAFGDVDGDGGVDVLVFNRDGPAHLFRNVMPTRGNWVSLRVLDEHGRDAYNALVQATIGDRTVTREVRAGYSYCASNDPRVHLGLGDGESIEVITVLWPGGVRERFGPVPAGTVTTLRRGEGIPIATSP